MLKNSLLQNGYPRGIINCNVNDVLNKREDRPLEPPLELSKNDVILVLPYLGFDNDAITRRLKSCVNKFYGFVNRFNRSQKSKIVYKASCWDCDAFYIGKRRLHDRKTEHFKHVKALTLTQVGHATAVADHSTFTGHNIKWNACT